MKGVQTDTSLVPRVVSLSTNMEMVTAIANDISYDDVFVYQLRSLARLGDVLVTISSSGDSENVARAASWARENALDVIAFTGFDGGRTARLATVNLHVDGDNYGVVEDIHQSLMHILAQYLRQARMSHGLIAGRKF
jgi:phosphoheptose isomerase